MKKLMLQLEQSPKIGNIYRSIHYLNIWTSRDPNVMQHYLPQGLEPNDTVLLLGYGSAIIEKKPVEIWFHVLTSKNEIGYVWSTNGSFFEEFEEVTKDNWMNPITSYRT